MVPGISSAATVAAELDLRFGDADAAAQKGHGARLCWRRLTPFKRPISFSFRAGAEMLKSASAAARVQCWLVICSRA